jgi:hypothetical protein
MDKEYVLELLVQVEAQTGDWRQALADAIDTLEVAITTERRSGE